MVAALPRKACLRHLSKQLASAYIKRFWPSSRANYSSGTVLGGRARAYRPAGSCLSRCYATGAAAAPTSLGLTRLPPVLVKKDTDISDPALWQNAAILVDKPQDWTSFDVCGKLRGTLHTKKARWIL